MNKAFRIISNVILVIIIIILSTYLLLRVTNVVVIYRVQTGSMEDGIHPGDYLLVMKQKDYKVGDIVTYHEKDYLVTHRIISMKGDELVTKGDANNTEDSPIQKSSIVGKMVHKSMFLNFIIDCKYLLVAILFIGYGVSYYLGREEEKEEEKSNSE